MSSGIFQSLEEKEREVVGKTSGIYRVLSQVEKAVSRRRE